LRDITLRALDVLRDCDLLVAEDSRVAQRLLAALQLPGKEIWTYHDHNAAAATPVILQRAQDRTVAVVTDAGTPGISDPGALLVANARAAGIAVEVLPGPSAAIGAAVLSGFSMRRFVFAGFLPRAAVARRKMLSGDFASGVPLIYYESPQRIVSALADIAALDPSRRIFLLREYTKVYEQQVCGTAQEVCSALEQPVRGELTLVVEGAPVTFSPPSEAEIGARMDRMLNEGRSVSAIAKALADEGCGQRRHLYAQAVHRKTQWQGSAQARKTADS